MFAYLIRRVGQSLLILFAMSLLVFLAVYAIGNPVDSLVSPDADQADRAAIIARLGLDRPIYEQYAQFLWSAVHGDLGTSFVYGLPATTVILDRLPATLELAVMALLLSLAIGIPLGVLAGLRPDSSPGAPSCRARSWASRCPTSGSV